MRHASQRTLKRVRHSTLLMIHVAVISVTIVTVLWITFLWFMVDDPYYFSTDISSLREWALAPVLGTIGLIDLLLCIGVSTCVWNVLVAATSRVHVWQRWVQTAASLFVVGAFVYGSVLWKYAANQYDNDRLMTAGELERAFDVQRAALDTHASRIMELRQRMLDDNKTPRSYLDVYVQDWEALFVSGRAIGEVGPFRGCQLDDSGTRLYFVTLRNGIGTDTRAEGFCYSMDDLPTGSIDPDQPPPRGSEVFLELDEHWYAFLRNGVFAHELEAPQR
ncbi:MAG: hypothetical protein KDC95_02495 [Planctomycetes bacterium]|nr:hypothetical protein [Planctomycetota bacterium]